MTGTDYDNVELFSELHYSARTLRRRGGFYSNKLVEGILSSLRIDTGRILIFHTCRMNATAASVSSREPSTFKLGVAWVALCLALAIHVTDEASTGFLSVYNPTVLALRAKLGFWPMPTFEFREWLTGLIVADVVLLALSPFVFRGSRWIRPVFYFFAVVMVFNALGHTAATILGHTVSTIRFPRPAPGFYSSPFVLAAAVYGLVQLKRARGA
ncbi:MAG TPA: hypothetical protein VJK29_17660 [Terriglobales bacterium]|nr:hypothetical protein [Terriglobales bacterium]